jgi:hypothetical protein
MFSKKELQLVYGLAVIFLIVGVISYAAFSAKPPSREPLRLMFSVAAGNVLFDHKTHTDVTGYGLSCGDCHHTLAEDEYDDAQSCSECHDPDEGDEEMPKRSDAFHQQCAGCHEDFGKGPVESNCNGCHVR